MCKHNTSPAPAHIKCKHFSFACRHASQRGHHGQHRSQLTSPPLCSRLCNAQLRIKTSTTDYEVVLDWGHGTANGPAEPLVLASVTFNAKAGGDSSGGGAAAIELIAVRTLEDGGDVLVLHQTGEWPIIRKRMRAPHIQARRRPRGTHVVKPCMPRGRKPAVAIAVAVAAAVAAACDGMEGDECEAAAVAAGCDRSGDHEPAFFCSGVGVRARPIKPLQRHSLTWGADAGDELSETAGELEFILTAGPPSRDLGDLASMAAAEFIAVHPLYRGRGHAAASMMKPALVLLRCSDFQEASDCVEAVANMLSMRLLQQQLGTSVIGSMTAVGPFCCHYLTIPQPPAVLLAATSSVHDAAAGGRLLRRMHESLLQTGFAGVSFTALARVAEVVAAASGPPVNLIHFQRPKTGPKVVDQLLADMSADPPDSRTAAAEREGEAAAGKAYARLLSTELAYFLYSRHSEGSDALAGEDMDVVPPSPRAQPQQVTTATFMDSLFSHAMHKECLDYVIHQRIYHATAC
ncbi:hypothetical protein JKP88DRAFT_251821 [Tribonema minus]|uniref:Uncharacterized protein n=1 Tax=Tribonema minus TaxID=303371 RepID=A0A835ZCE6_9STRA|nr:hypothetical protein JKP88DRAFT_251821 [Tribonema minus]